VADDKQDLERQLQDIGSAKVGRNGIMCVITAKVRCCKQLFLQQLLVFHCIKLGDVMLQYRDTHLFQLPTWIQFLNVSQ